MSNTYSYTNSSVTPKPDATDMRVGLVVTEWNSDITERLMELAIEELKADGVSENNITVRRVPGSFELIFGCSQMMRHGYIDAVIAIGCVIRGDTPHFDYICQGTTQGLAELNLRGDIPVINGLLTVNTPEQAQERAETKGQEFALTALRMIDFSREMRN